MPKSQQTVIFVFELAGCISYFKRFNHNTTTRFVLLCRLFLFLSVPKRYHKSNTCLCYTISVKEESQVLVATTTTITRLYDVDYSADPQQCILPTGPSHGSSMQATVSTVLEGCTITKQSPPQQQQQQEKKVFCLVQVSGGNFGRAGIPVGLVESDWHP